jgi:hypothetical protein
MRAHEHAHADPATEAVRGLLSADHGDIVDLDRLALGRSRHDAAHKRIRVVVVTGLPMINAVAAGSARSPLEQTQLSQQTRMVGDADRAARPLRQALDVLISP